MVYSLSGYGFMDIGLPPASPSDKDIDLKVRWYLSSILFKNYIEKWKYRFLGKGSTTDCTMCVWP